MNIGNKVHYLKSKTIITSTKTRLDKPYLYKGIRATYDYGTRLAHRYEEVIVNYIKDKETVYMPDGLEIFCDKEGNIKKDVGVINKDDKMVSSKELTTKDIDIFKELYTKSKKKSDDTYDGWFQKSLK